MKKLLLTLGTLTSVATPIVAVVSCSTDERFGADTDKPQDVVVLDKAKHSLYITWGSGGRGGSVYIDNASLTEWKHFGLKESDY